MSKDFNYERVYFTMGPLSIYQFAEFSKCGMGALKLFQYIKTKQGLTKEEWVVVDNVNAYKWFGLSTSSKWRAIVKLREKKQDEKYKEKENSQRGNDYLKWWLSKK